MIQLLHGLKMQHLQETSNSPHLHTSARLTALSRTAVFPNMSVPPNPLQFHQPHVASGLTCLVSTLCAMWSHVFPRNFSLFSQPLCALSMRAQAQLTGGWSQVFEQSHSGTDSFFHFLLCVWNTFMEPFPLSSVTKLYLIPYPHVLSKRFIENFEAALNFSSSCNMSTD